MIFKSKKKLFVEIFNLVSATHGCIKNSPYGYDKIQRIDHFNRGDSTYEDIATLVGLKATRDELIDLLKADGWEVIEPKGFHPLTTGSK